MKKLIIAVILFVVIGLIILNLTFYQELKELKKDIQINVDSEQKQTNDKVITELTGNLISFEQNKKIIEIFSQEFNKNIIITYNENTLFYIHEIMSDERYKQSLSDYEEKIKEPDIERGVTKIPEIPFQDLYRQFNSIKDLNLKNGERLVVPFEKNSAGQIIALNIIKLREFT